jgi:hypothetical protein
MRPCWGYFVGASWLLMQSFAASEPGEPMNALATDIADLKKMVTAA